MIPLLCCLLANPQTIQEAVRLAAISGRITLIAETDRERISPALTAPPGRPPLLSFRYYEGARRHRFGDLDLVVDDAGH
jgi:hypothetical protein